MPIVPAVAHQSSHVLLVLGNPRPGREAAFAAWFRGPHRDAVLEIPAVLAGRHLEHDDVDVTHGRYPRLPYRYLAVYELSLDGAEDAADTIAAIRALHRESDVADDPASWLYFPISEKAGVSTPDAPYLTIAFANPVAGAENEFREWYSTRHIRHALYLPPLASGQCFERTGFQDPGAAAPDHQVIAIYEQTGDAHEFLDAIGGIDRSLLAFPTMDKTRFSESAFRALG